MLLGLLLMVIALYSRMVIVLYSRVLSLQFVKIATRVLGWFTKALEIEHSVLKAEMVMNQNRSCQRQNVLAGRRWTLLTPWT